jgi:hypothetical protein
MTKLSGLAEEAHSQLTNNFEYFARYGLKIKTKDGKVEPFIFNKAQSYLHKRLEDQKRRIGRVRVYIVKGRQQGCSTYVGGRFYHRATRTRGTSVFILSHEAETTKKLFRIVERYHDNCPALLRPTTRIANRRELHFDQIESDYSIGTAGNENVGRGGTIQLFHGSEVAFWERTEEIKTGILQSVPDLDDTEVILESTANGMGNMFYEGCMQALDGLGDYEVIFIPWYWQDEYRATVPKDFVLSADDQVYQKTYKLSLEQMAWRARKIVELGHTKFKQEYPANIMEAFQTSGKTFMDPESIMRARQSQVADTNSPLVLGVDPGRTKDRSVFVERQGRKMLGFEAIRLEQSPDVQTPTPWQMILAGKVANRINTRGYDKVFIDVGEGWGVVDRLVEIGFGQIVQGIHFGSKPIEEDQYLNKRAEMWSLMRDWFDGESGEVSIPDDDRIHKDLMLMPEERHTSRGLVQLVSKEDIRKNNSGISPDIADALALTFAYPVARSSNDRTQRIRKAEKAKSPLTTMRRLRSGKTGLTKIR